MSMTLRLPILLTLDSAMGLIVGAGGVGCRKALALLEAGARVRHIGLEPAPDIAHPAWEYRQEAYRPDHLDSVQLVFAAARGEVNRQIVRDAHQRGLWVNVADAPGEGDFFLPATIRQGALTLAISTGGAAPALARRLRERLEREFDSAWADWLRLLEEMRPLILARITEEAQRRAWFDQFSDWPWLERMRIDGYDVTRHAMMSALTGV